MKVRLLIGPRFCRAAAGDKPGAGHVDVAKITCSSFCSTGGATKSWRFG